MFFKADSPELTYCSIINDRFPNPLRGIMYFGCLYVEVKSYSLEELADNTTRANDFLASLEPNLSIVTENEEKLIIWRQNELLSRTSRFKKEKVAA